MFFDDKGYGEKRGDMTIVLIENPKNVFSSDESISVVEQMRDVAADGFGVDPKLQSIQGIRDHVINVDALVVCHSNENILGFGSVKFREDFDLVFLHGIVVLMSHQNKGIGSMILEPILRFHKRKRIAFTTQNPAMYQLAKKLCNKIFPSQADEEIPLSIKEIGYELVKNRRGIFCTDTFVSNGLFERCLYRKIPSIDDKTTDTWFKGKINVVDGVSVNGMLILGDLKS